MYWWLRGSSTYECVQIGACVRTHMHTCTLTHSLNHWMHPTLPYPYFHLRPHPPKIHKCKDTPGKLKFKNRYIVKKLNNNYVHIQFPSSKKVIYLQPSNFLFNIRRYQFQMKVCAVNVCILAFTTWLHIWACKHYNRSQWYYII